MKERRVRAPAWWPAPRPGPPWWHGQDEDVGSGGGPGARSAAGGHAGVGEPSAPAGHRLPWPSTVLLTALVLVGTHAAAQGQRGGARAALDPFALVLLLLACAALLWRRRHPVAVVFTTAAVVMVYLGAGYPYGPVFLTVALACFGAVVTGHRRAAWAAAAMLWAGHVVLAHWLYRLLPPTGDSAAPWGQEAVVAAWVATVVAVSELAGVRREQWARERAERAQAARRRADEERLRMARELHDVLAHSISVINVQAGVGLALLDSDPEQARTALTTIKSASKEALGEVRQVLEGLRTPGEAPRAPAPGLDRLPELVAQAADAGLTVEVEGTPPKLPPGADLAAFRIVQEALTNVVRHSGSRQARIRISSGGGVLRLRIDDDGPSTGADAGGSGNGLAGMRERAAALGGTIEAGRRVDGGFRVLAVLPLRAPPAEGTREPRASHGPPEEER
ncbi:sensor histidine kinase [Streptomyces jietaisiensis]|uniref:histidine kinase n=1 Tax=Streptomyces griseoaurantiacus TaxID=68213 RepID=A0ABZ1V8R7_9ACTN|nr:MULTISPECIES: sensor histidine kinase [Streptomyces]MDX3358199.1 sensor histidine kinase [Streptomyces sp. ME02-6978.2a]